MEIPRWHNNKSNKPCYDQQKIEKIIAGYQSDKSCWCQQWPIPSKSNRETKAHRKAPCKHATQAENWHPTTEFSWLKKWHTQARMSSIPYFLISLGAKNLYVTASRKYLLKMDIFKILTTCILKNRKMPAYIQYSIAKTSSSKRHRKKILDKQLQVLSSEMTTTRDDNITSQPASLYLWPGCCPIQWNSGTWPLGWGKVLVRWWGVDYPLSILPQAWISCLRLEPEKLLKKGKVKHLSRSKIKVGSFVSLLSLTSIHQTF